MWRNFHSATNIAIKYLIFTVFKSFRDTVYMALFLTCVSNAKDTVQISYDPTVKPFFPSKKVLFGYRKIQLSQMKWNRP